MKHHAEVVLAALLAGQEVELDGRAYRFMRKGDTFVSGGGEYEVLTTGLMCKLEVLSVSPRGKRESRVSWGAADMPLGAFIEACEALPDAQVFVIGGQTVLRRQQLQRRA